jgi:hypothetical protein
MFFPGGGVKRAWKMGLKVGNFRENGIRGVFLYGTGRWIALIRVDMKVD